MDDFLDFLGSIIFFRRIRDIDKYKWIWMDHELDSIKNGGFAAEEVQRMTLEVKLAELIDDRKQWLLAELEQDLYRINYPGCHPAAIEFPDPRGSDWWFEQVIFDDTGDEVSMGTDSEKGTVYISGNMKADDEETATRLLRERVAEFLASIPQAA